MFVATVSLRGLGHDSGRGVAALHVTGGGAHNPTCCARLQSEGCAKGREGCYQHRNHDFDNLLFGHNFFSFGARRDSAELVFNFECKDNTPVNNVYHQNGNFIKKSYLPRLLAS